MKLVNENIDISLNLCIIVLLSLWNNEFSHFSIWKLYSSWKIVEKDQDISDVSPATRGLGIFYITEGILDSKAWDLPWANTDRIA